jgi:hypothetical protein
MAVVDADPQPWLDSRVNGSHRSERGWGRGVQLPARSAPGCRPLPAPPPPPPRQT